jgi:hypothetical protein
VFQLFSFFFNLLVEALRHHLDEVFSPSRNTFSPQISHTKEQSPSCSPVAVHIDQSHSPQVKRLSKNSRKEQEVVETSDLTLELSLQRRERRSKKLNDKTVENDCRNSLTNSQNMKPSHWNFDEKNLLKSMRGSQAQPCRQSFAAVSPAPLDDNLLDSYTKRLSKKVWVWMILLANSFPLLGLS